MTDYRSAGVDLRGADRHVDAIRSVVTNTWGDSVVGGFGGFAAGIELPAGLRRPVLMLSTDGVGTKLELARQFDAWSGVGFDLVAMCVDDLTAVGAAPIGFVDYMAVGRLHPERDTAVVASIAAACQAVGAPLVGGETAEHPGVMDPHGIDLAGAALGVVEFGSEIDGSQIQEGDLIIGLASRNLRSNGFSLVRAILGDSHLDTMLDDRKVAEIVLEPSVLFSPAVLAAMASGSVTGAAHITGGGLPGNLARPLRDGLAAIVDTGAWTRPAIFGFLQKVGQVTDEAMFDAFNMGIGFSLFVRPDAVDGVSASVSSCEPIVIGEVRAGMSGVHLS